MASLLYAPRRLYSSSLRSDDDGIAGMRYLRGVVLMVVVLTREDRTGVVITFSVFLLDSLPS